jgi:biotin carboxyl carrier protein
MKKYKFAINGQQFEVDIKDFDFDKAKVVVNGTEFNVDIDRKKKSVPAIVNRAPVSATAPVAKPKKAVAGAILAPLPGNIFKINVKEGDTVKRGDTVLIMEAMKMENNVLAEGDGTVKKILVKEGDSVLQSDALIEIG